MSVLKPGTSILMLHVCAKFEEQCGTVVKVFDSGAKGVTMKTTPLNT